MLFLRDAVDRSIFRTLLHIYTSISFSLYDRLERGLLEEHQGVLSNKNARSQTVTGDSLSDFVEPHTNRARVRNDDIYDVSCYRRRRRAYNYQTLTLVITYIRFRTVRYLLNIRRNVRYANGTKTIRWRPRTLIMQTTPRPYGGDLERSLCKRYQDRTVDQDRTVATSNGLRVPSSRRRRSKHNSFGGFFTEV